jgi:hypothetical protein
VVLGKNLLAFPHNELDVLTGHAKAADNTPQV